MKSDWFAGSLDDACVVEYGTRVVRKKDGGSVYPVYGGGGETFRMDTFNREDRVVVSRFGVSEECIRYVSGKFFLNDSGLTVSARDRNKLSQHFLDYQLFALNDAIYKLCRGTAQKNLDVESFRQMTIAAPKKFSEQQRIVAVLDEAFAGLATATANAEKNLKNARELFESYLASIFVNKGRGWIERPIGECIRVSSGDFLPQKKMKPGSIDVYGGNGIAGQHNEANLHGENVIIGRVGAKCGNVRSVAGDIWLTDNALYVSSYLQPFNRKFLAYLLNLKNLRSTANQAAQPVISYTTIKNVVLSFPASTQEQHKIELQLDEIESEAERLANMYRRKMNVIDDLKQAILQKAFSGELTSPPSQAIKEAAA